RLAEYRHVAGVAAEGSDVVAHPLQGKDGVEHAGVAAAAELRPADIGEVQVAEGVEAVVDRDYDDVVAPGQVGAAVPAFGAGPGGETAAVQPDHYRALAAIDLRRPDVEDQAVLALRQHGDIADGA